MAQYQNPIIPGFYPDPSICRDGEDYFLVTSSFEFFPGVPLWHSRDLVNWEQLGHILTRERQLPLKNAWTSGGIYAPTLRKHGDTWYMITTNCGGGGNFLVTAPDVRGPWSDPVWIGHDGIDPSLFWDDDGSVYYTGTWIDPVTLRQGIGQFRVDTATGEKLSDTRIIWYGTGGRCPEAPHMYKIGGWYYLMIAEGGTEYGHMVTVARSRNVWGPFESCPHNPILTHRDDICSPFQAIGHGDLVTGPQGNWWIVFHGIRPSAAQLHHLGRETMLAPVTWDEAGWPVVNGGRSVTEWMDGPASLPRQDWEDRFTGLLPRWSFLRDPDPAAYGFGEEGVTLLGKGTSLNAGGAPTFLGIRQTQFSLNWETEIRMEGDGEAGITVFHTDEHHYDIAVSREGGCLCARLRRRAADMEVFSEPVRFEGAERLRLQIRGNRHQYTFLAGPDGSSMVTLGTGSTRLISTEAMPCTFTGCFIGLFAEGGTQARFPFFRETE